MARLVQREVHALCNTDDGLLHDRSHARAWEHRQRRVARVQHALHCSQARRQEQRQQRLSVQRLSQRQRCEALRGLVHRQRRGLRQARAALPR